jgi:integrase
VAVLENINYQPMMFKPSSLEKEYEFVINLNRKSVDSFPQIFLSDGVPWSEANSYAFYRYEDLQKDIKTVNREMTHLARYANWLEHAGLHWLHFPQKKAERCLFRFRGFLIEQREKGFLAPSSISQNMNSVVAFYRWASAYGYADKRSNLFDDKNKIISFFDKVGFSRTISITSSELSIPNRARTGTRLEDGLTPMNRASAKKLLSYLTTHRNHELYLMTKLALQSGCRHETVATLNIDALKKAYPDQMLTNIMRVRVGPGTGVETKHDVSGDFYIPKTLSIELIDYFNSAEAILRRSRAPNNLQRNIFLTTRGNRYTNQTFGTLLYRLKEELIRVGNTEFGRFKFHQLRATFGTMLMRALLNTQGMSSLNAIEFVKEAMLHKDASTTWRYIKFVEKEPIEELFLDNLWSLFTGSEKKSDDIIEQFSRG